VTEDERKSVKAKVVLESMAGLEKEYEMAE